jgi:hypothetical protein
VWGSPQVQHPVPEPHFLPRCFLLLCGTYGEGQRLADGVKYLHIGGQELYIPCKRCTTKQTRRNKHSLGKSACIARIASSPVPVQRNQQNCLLPLLDADCYAAVLPCSHQGAGVPWQLAPAVSCILMNIGLLWLPTCWQFGIRVLPEPELPAHTHHPL